MTLTASSKHPERRLAYPPSKVNILLVDDEPKNLLTLQRVLAPLEENLVTALSGKEALKKILQESFAVILLDVSMPDIDGFQVADLVRKRESTKETPIIFVTAYDIGIDGIFRGYESGAVDYLVKPIQPKILLSKVRVFVELHRKTLELGRQREIAIAELNKNRELYEENKLLERMKEEAEQFASIASHDLQTPLRHIGNYIEVLKEDLGAKASAEQLEALDVITAGTKRMKTLINDLLAISRIGPQSVNLMPVDLDGLIADVLDTLVDEIEEAKAKVIIRPLPTIYADEGKMHLVFQNLICNALKYRSPDRDAEVIVTGEINGNFCLISVKDNGIGIGEEHFSRIFEIFQRLHRNNEFSGTGIGLAICKKIVMLHGGDIWLESRIGEGSVFYLKLPMALPIGKVSYIQ